MRTKTTHFRARSGRLVRVFLAVLVGFTTTSVTPTILAQPAATAAGTSTPTSVSNAVTPGGSGAGGVLSTTPGSTTPSAAKPPRKAFGEAASVQDIALDDKARFEAACINAAFFESHVADLTTCYGEKHRGAWEQLAATSKGYRAERCVARSADEVANRSKLEQEWTAASEQAAAVALKLSNAQIAVDAAKALNDTDKLIAAEQAKAALQRESQAAEATKKAKQEALAQFDTAAYAAGEAALLAFHAAVSEAENQARSQESFEALVEFEELAKTKTRRAACMKLRQSERTQLMSLDGVNAATIKVATIANEVATKPYEDHAVDTLRRSQGTASSTTTTSSLIENPGSPDKVAFSILSGLGADSKTTGTQTVLNLSLSSLFWPDDDERLAQPVWQRNLFVRGAFPLSATDKVPQTGAGAASAGTAAEVSRFSLLLGGSLEDETDTRLPAAKECYELAAVFVPFPQTSDEAPSRTEQRKELYDVCARLSARKARLAWRGGVGFYTPNNVDTPKTRPELGVGAIVWGPTSWLYFNFLYQGIIRPARIDNMGVGFSLASNLDGTGSGVNAVARVGLDFIFLLKYEHEDKATDWEMRIAPTVRGKLFGNSIGTLAVGPRFLGSDIDSPGLLATLALTYDADTLVNSLLTPTTTPTK